MKYHLKIAAIFLYILACFLPAYTDANGLVMRGYDSLAMGVFLWALGGLYPIAALAWLANVCWATALVYDWKGQRVSACWAAGAGLGLSLLGLFVRHFPLDDEAVRLGAAVPVWIAAMAVMLAAMLQDEQQTE